MPAAVGAADAVLENAHATRPTADPLPLVPEERAGAADTAAKGAG